MEKTDSVSFLKELILVKQAKHEDEGKQLKEYFHHVSESFKPVNIIKSTVKDLISSPDLKTNIVNTAMGLTSGLVAKKIVVGNTYNPLTKVLGLIVEMIVARKVTNNADEIKTFAGLIFKKLINKTKSD